MAEAGSSNFTGFASNSLVLLSLRSSLGLSSFRALSEFCLCILLSLFLILKSLPPLFSVLLLLLHLEFPNGPRRIFLFSSFYRPIKASLRSLSSSFDQRLRFTDHVLPSFFKVLPFLTFFPSAFLKRHAFLFLLLLGFPSADFTCSSSTSHHQLCLSSPPFSFYRWITIHQKT